MCINRDINIITENSFPEKFRRSLKVRDGIKILRKSEPSFFYMFPYSLRIRVGEHILLLLVLMRCAIMHMAVT